MKNQYTEVTYNNKEYIVANTPKNTPFVIDKIKLSSLPDVMFYKAHNYINCRIQKYIYLHYLITGHTFDGKMYIDHINRIPTDNRISNLRLATQSEQNKNQSKRKRNVILPDDCGINPRDIPTFIWYIRPEGSHGDRWMVEIKNKYEWKTTSSKKLSTKAKFELAKKHLKELKEKQPELLDGHCMNGELSDLGKILAEEYYEILKLAGY